MSKEELLNFFASNGQSFNIKNTFMLLSIGLVVGLIIYFTYYVCSDKTVYNRKFNGTIVLTLLITDLIMMMISSNIAISLGMVGALSIVRFRTALKDSRDTIFLFWAIAEGLCVGTQSFKMVAASVIFIALVVLFISKIPSFYNKYIVIIQCSNSSIEIKDINEVLKPYIKSDMIRSLNKDDTHQEFIIEICAKGQIDSKLVSELMKLDGVSSVNCVIETGDSIG